MDLPIQGIRAIPEIQVVILIRLPIRETLIIPARDRRGITDGATVTRTLPVTPAGTTMPKITITGRAILLMVVRKAATSN